MLTKRRSNTIVALAAFLSSVPQAIPEPVTLIPAPQEGQQS